MTKTKSQYKVIVREEYCKGCGLCIEFCNKKVLAESQKLNKMGYHYAETVNNDECVGCLICTLVCPDVVIEVYSE